MLSRYTVSYRVVGTERQASVQVDTPGRLTNKTAKRLISQSRGLKQTDIEITEIKERKP